MFTYCDPDPFEGKPCSIAFKRLMRATERRGEPMITGFRDEELSTESIRLRPGQLFKYIHHISRDREREVSVAVYRGSEVTPFEEATYYLK